jgi:hypothetical protein
MAKVNKQGAPVVNWEFEGCCDDASGGGEDLKKLIRYELKKKRKKGQKVLDERLPAWTSLHHPQFLL